MRVGVGRGWGGVRVKEGVRVRVGVGVEFRVGFKPQQPGSGRSLTGGPPGSGGGSEPERGVATGGIGGSSEAVRGVTNGAS